MSRKPEPSSADASLARRIRMLRTAMGPEIAAALEDPEVVEVLSLVQEETPTATIPASSTG